MKTAKIFLLLPFALVASSCVTYGPDVLGLAPVQPGGGPQVKWDLSARPLPEIPFPNDAATFPDNDSPTGRRVNASMVGPTEFESHVRKQLDTLDGFGTYAPITVSFDQPLDLDVIHDAMRGDDAFADDVLYLVSLDKNSPRYGKPVILDVGNGNFPVVLAKTTFFPSDERAGQSNLVLETEDETVLGDTNHDGVITVPNVLHEGDDTDRNMMTFYEKATNTLIVRPLLPLDEETTYAVILTRRIKSRFGEAIRSPFNYINDASQTHTLRPLVDDGILTNLGLTTDDVAFTWAFTTQSTTKDLIAIREGLEGYGPFSSLAGKYPAMLSTIDPVKDHPSQVGSIYVLDGGLLRALLRDHFLDIFGGTQAELDAILLNYQFVDYLVAGTYDTPNFVDPDDGMFHVNRKTGQYRVGHDTVTFTMAIPRTTETHKPPFPMQVHIHGYTSSRLELVLWAGTFCRFGGATLTIDAWGHGGATFSPDQEGPITALLGIYGMQNAAKSIFDKGRAKDLNGDGVKDNGGDFWSADLFHTRDVVRQTAIDAMQGIRIFKECDGVKTWPFDPGDKGHPMIACDFNRDGIPDTGGPFNTYSVVGGSLGGILTGIIGPVEPNISHGVEVSGGAGLADIGLRSTIGGVNEAVLLRTFGPMLLAYDDHGAKTLGFTVPDVTKEAMVPVAALPADAQAGDRMELTNLRTGKTGWTILDASLTGRIEMGADQGDPMQIVIRTGGDPSAPVRDRISKLDRDEVFQQKTWHSGHDIVAPAEGWGFKRQTPDFRRFFSIGAIVTEPGDPVSYARGWFLEPFDVKPYGKRTKNVMMVPTLGDNSVPIATEVAMARAAGLIPVTAYDARNPDIRYGRGAPWVDGTDYQQWYDTKLTWDQWRTAAGTAWAPDSADLAPSPNAVFLRNFVIEGEARLRRFETDPRFNNSAETLFDIDDLSDGTDQFGQPRAVEPMRILRRTATGVSAVRLPFLSPQGQHGFGFYEPDLPFDMPSYMHALLGHYSETHARELIDAPCNAKENCAFIPVPPGDPIYIPDPHGQP